MCQWLITQPISAKIVIKPIKFSLKPQLSWTWQDRMGAILAARGIRVDNAVNDQLGFLRDAW